MSQRSPSRRPPQQRDAVPAETAPVETASAATEQPAAQQATGEQSGAAPVEVAQAEDKIFVGRTLEIAQISRALLAGSNVVVKGRAGIGKRALLTQVRAQLAEQRVCLHPSTATPKQFLADLAEQLHAAFGLAVPERLIPPRFRAAAARTGSVPYRHIKRSLGREPVADQLSVIRQSLQGRSGAVLFVDSLEVPPTLANMITTLTEQTQLCAAMEDSNRRSRIDRLLWQVQVQTDLKALPPEHCRDWIETWLDAHPVTFESPRVRSAFIRTLVRDSAGIPAALQGMLDLTLIQRHVDRSTLRLLGHEAAVSYLDMTPILVILSVAFMAMRYISRGMGMKELMVLAGVGTSMFYLLLYFTRFMAAKRR